jgi:allantoicase
VRCDFATQDPGEPLDLMAVAHGGRLVACSDQHYGTPLNIAFPGVGASMGEGWETHRRRQPGNEWAIFALGQPGEVVRVEIDTTHFKGNAPERCSIQAAGVVDGSETSVVAGSLFWRQLLAEQRLQPDCNHVFERDVAPLGVLTHVRLNVIPDGGINRMRLFGLRR